MELRDLPTKDLIEELKARDGLSPFCMCYIQRDAFHIVLKGDPFLNRNLIEELKEENEKLVKLRLEEKDRDQMSLFKGT